MSLTDKNSYHYDKYYNLNIQGKIKFYGNIRKQHKFVQIWIIKVVGHVQRKT